MAAPPHMPSARPHIRTPRATPQGPCVHARASTPMRSRPCVHTRAFTPVRSHRRWRSQSAFTAPRAPHAAQGGGSADSPPPAAAWGHSRVVSSATHERPLSHTSAIALSLPPRRHTSDLSELSCRWHELHLVLCALILSDLLSASLTFSLLLSASLLGDLVLCALLLSPSLCFSDLLSASLTFSTRRSRPLCSP